MPHVLGTVGGWLSQCWADGGTSKGIFRPHPHFHLDFGLQVAVSADSTAWVDRMEVAVVGGKVEGTAECDTGPPPRGSLSPNRAALREALGGWWPTLATLTLMCTVDGCFSGQRGSAEHHLPGHLLEVGPEAGCWVRCLGYRLWV